jgi:hypothetical protein
MTREGRMLEIDGLKVEIGKPGSTKGDAVFMARDL